MGGAAARGAAVELALRAAAASATGVWRRSRDAGGGRALLGGGEGGVRARVATPAAGVAGESVDALGRASFEHIRRGDDAGCWSGGRG